MTDGQTDGGVLEIGSVFYLFGFWAFLVSKVNDFSFSSEVTVQGYNNNDRKGKGIEGTASSGLAHSTCSRDRSITVA